MASGSRCNDGQGTSKEGLTDNRCHQPYWSKEEAIDRVLQTGPRDSGGMLVLFAGGEAIPMSLPSIPPLTSTDRLAEMSYHITPGRPDPGVRRREKMRPVLSPKNLLARLQIVA